MNGRWVVLSVLYLRTVVLVIFDHWWEKNVKLGREGKRKHACRCYFFVLFSFPSAFMTVVSKCTVGRYT